MKEKRYGDTKTKLELTEKARRAYNEYSPLSIYETEDDDGVLSYRIDGCVEAYNLTEDEVNETLESLLSSPAQDIIDAGLYNAAVNLMDDDIREELHSEIAPCTDIEFLEAYMKRHEEKYGVPFTV